MSLFSMIGTMSFVVFLAFSVVVVVVVAAFAVAVGTVGYCL